jgi:predicted phosphodiesterase
MSYQGKEHVIVKIESPDVTSLAAQLAEKATKTEVIESKNELNLVESDATIIKTSVSDLTDRMNYMRFTARLLRDNVNFVKNGKFTDTTNWPTGNASLSALNNILSITKTGTGATALVNQTTDLVYENKKKIYVRAKFRIPVAGATEIGLRVFGSATTGFLETKTITNPSVGVWNTISGVIDLNSTAAGNVIIQLYTQYPDNATALNKVTEVQEAYAVDLTSNFGRGNEPTKKWLDESLFVPEEKYTFYVITDTHIAFDDGIWDAKAPERLRRMQAFVTRANIDKPNMVIHLGDAVQTNVDWDSFMPLWKGITQPKLYIAGNHDFDNFQTFEQIAMKFGYQGRVPINGNKFNYSEMVTFGDVQFLLISLDTNVNYSWEGKLDQTRLDWVANLLNTTTAPFAIIFSHAAPHTYPSTYFNQTDAIALKNVVDTALSTNSNLARVQGIHGHSHPTNTYTDTATLGVNFPGLVLKANTGTSGAFTKITIDTNENIAWETVTL